MKVISGGQIGADIAGLRAAKSVGFETGGLMPKGFRTLEGEHPEYAELYGIRESPEVGYPHRTRYNVGCSDGTLRFAVNWNSPGERLTSTECRKQGKPHYDVTLRVHGVEVRFPRTQVIMWLELHNIKVLNIAGNARKDIELPIEQFLVAIFKQLIRDAS